MEKVSKKSAARNNQFMQVDNTKYRGWLRLPLEEQILIIKRLALLIKAGVPIVKSLQMLESQAASNSTKFILRHLVMTVERGGYLSAGLVQFRKIFGDFAVNVVEVGELSGSLQDNLHYLSEELKKKQEVRRKIQGALVYPSIIVLATIGIVVLLTGIIFPKIMPLFMSFNFKLPFTTRILIFVSNLLKDEWLGLLFGICIFLFLVLILLKVYSVRLRVHYYILRFPVFGRLLQGYHVANFTRTLGLLLKSEVPVVKALNTTAKTMTNLAYREAVIALADRLTHGETLSKNISKVPQLFPIILSQMVEVGETTGSLNSTLLFLAEMYENEIDDLTKNITTIIEPVLMVFIGVVVGFVALAIITPIYGITQNIHP